MSERNASTGLARPRHAGRPASTFASRVLCAAWLALGAACSALAHERVEPEPPWRALDIRHHAGSPLAGPLPEGVAPALDADAAHAFGVSCALLFLERFPTQALEHLPAHARLVTASTGSEPFLSSAQLAASVRAGRGDVASEFWRRASAGEFGPQIPIAELAGVLPSGVTIAFDASASGATSELASFEFFRRGEMPDAPVEIALALEGWRIAEPPRAPDAETSASETSGAARGAQHATPERVHETVLLDTAPEPGGAPLVLVIPTTSTNPKTGVATLGALVAALGVTPAPLDEPARSEHEAKVASCLEEIAAARRGASERRAEFSPGEAFVQEVRSAFHALGAERTNRSALVFLAGACGAPLALDLALAADDARLAQFGGKLRAAAGPIETLAVDRRSLGWLVERTAYHDLATSVAEGTLPLELSGILLRHAGEVGRYAGTIEDVLRASDGIEALLEQLARENRIFLEDSLPAARVRAFDWLALRGLAPSGYDPLASRDARRAALASADAAEQGASASAGGPTSTGAPPR